MQGISKEHKRLVKIAQGAKDEVIMKATDSVVVISINKDGLWASSSNLSNKQLSETLSGVSIELKELLRNQNNN